MVVKVNGLPCDVCGAALRHFPHCDVGDKVATPTATLPTAEQVAEFIAALIPTALDRLHNDILSVARKRAADGAWREQSQLRMALQRIRSLANDQANDDAADFGVRYRARIICTLAAAVLDAQDGNMEPLQAFYPKTEG